MTLPVRRGPAAEIERIVLLKQIHCCCCHRDRRQTWRAAQRTDKGHTAKITAARLSLIRTSLGRAFPAVQARLIDLLSKGYDLALTASDIPDVRAMGKPPV